MMDYRKGRPHSAWRRPSVDARGGHTRAWFVLTLACSPACTTSDRIASSTVAEGRHAADAEVLHADADRGVFVSLAVVVAADVLIDPRRSPGWSCSRTSATRPSLRAMLLTARSASVSCCSTSTCSSSATTVQTGGPVASDLTSEDPVQPGPLSPRSSSAPGATTCAAHRCPVPTSTSRSWSAPLPRFRRDTHTVAIPDAEEPMRVTAA